MSFTITHAKVSAIPDGPDTDVVRPSDWNAAHSVSGTAGTADIADNAVTPAKLGDIGTDRLMGRDTAGTGDPEQIGVAGGIEFTGSGGIQTSAFTGDVTKAAGGTALTVAAGAVTLAKMASIATSSVIGRSSAGSGAPENIALDASLTMAGGSLGRSALSGDVTASAGSNATTVAKIRSTAVSGTTGTGNVVFSASPALTGLVTVNANAAALPAGIAGTVFQLGQVDGTATRAVLDSFAAQASYDLRRANNTAASPSALAANDIIGQIAWFGRGATTYTNGARALLRGSASEAWTDAANGTYISLHTTPNGTAFPVESLRINASGGVSIGNPADLGKGTLSLSACTTALPAPLSGTMLQMGNVDGTRTRLQLNTSGTSIFSALHLETSRGTAAARTASQNNDFLGAVTILGYKATAVAGGGAFMIVNATENYTDTAAGTAISFYTTPNGTDNAAQAILIQNSGGLSIGGANDPGTGCLGLGNFLNTGGFARVSTQFDKTSDTTLANITALTATLVAGKAYFFEALLYTSSNVAGGVKFAIAGTATATAIVTEAVVMDGTAISAHTRATALATSVGGVTGVTAAYARITGTITVNAAGTLTVQFAQNASNGAASSVLVGSTFRVFQVT